jgi:FMN phosphatase YigB (HAD superfamily)
MPEMKAAIFDYNRTLFDPDKNALFPRALSVLKALEPRLTLALVAKGDDEKLEEITKFGLMEYFSEVLIAEEKGMDVFRKCIEKLRAEPQEICVIGDRALKEVKFGKALGCTTIWLRNGKYREELPRNIEEMPNYTISSLKEVLKILK